MQACPFLALQDSIMAVSSYLAKTGAPLSDRAANEVLRDAIVAAGEVPLRNGDALFAQDAFPILLEQLIGILLAAVNPPEA